MTYPPDVHFSRDLRLWIERDGSPGSPSLPFRPSRCGFEVVPEMLGPTGVVRTGLLATLVDTAGGEGAIRAARPKWVATSQLVLHGIRPVVQGIVEPDRPTKAAMCKCIIAGVAGIFVTKLLMRLLRCLCRPRRC